MTTSKLTEERDRIANRLQFMNVRSTGRDMLEKRLKQIDYELALNRLSKAN